MASLDTKVSDMTIAELLSCIDEYFENKNKAGEKIRGIKGLADYLKCSLRTAQELKSSGKIDKAIQQSGRVIIIDKDKLNKILSPR